MPSAPVDIVSMETIGFFETTVLSSEDPAALETWLVDNDYDVPPGASPIIEEYVDLGYYWVALKLTPDADVGALEPVVISYRGEPCIPLLRRPKSSAGGRPIPPCSICSTAARW